MSPGNVDAPDEFESYLDQPVESSPKQFVAVPPSLPPLDAPRSAGLLDKPYRGVGIEGPRCQDTPTGKVWAALTVLGIAIAMVILGAVAMLATGDWVILVIVCPLFGLWFAGMVRTIYVEQVAKKKKMARLERRLRDMKD